jgi:ATP-binding cassette, subfamily B, bacterial PglK
VIDDQGVRDRLKRIVEDEEIVSRSGLLASIYERIGFADSRQFLIVVGVGIIVLLALTNAISAFSRWLYLRFAWGVHDRLSQRLLRKYLGEDYGFFLQRNSSDLNKNLLVEVRSVVDYIIIPYMDILSRGMIVLFLVMLLLVVDPLLAIVAAGTLGGAYVLIFAVVRKKHEDLGVRRNIAFGERFQVVGEAFGSIKDTKILGREDYFLSRFADASRRFSDANTKQTVISEMPRFALETIAFGGIIATVIYLLGTRESLNEVLPIIGLYAIAGYRLMPALQIMFGAISHIRFHHPLLSALHADLHSGGGAEVKPPLGGPRFGDRPSGAMSVQREIRLSGVVFQYPGADQPALQGVDVVIPAKSTIALVGATGSGKTTLVDLLLGLHQPASGEILVDGVAITPDNLSSWRATVGYVSQSIYLTDSSIANNIAFGIPDNAIDHMAVERAAAAAHLDSFVGNLPDEYRTVVGERGVRLSGGERQRIAIARALYRDPEVLVMDEATSALDGATEEAVMQAIRSLSGRKTIILIAHRLSTVRECDRIFLIEGGRVASSGTYSELVAQSATFRRMARGETEQ